MTASEKSILECIYNATQDDIENILIHINAPYVKGSRIDLANKPSLFIKISLDKKETWLNGYIENSNYFVFHLCDNKMELTAVSRRPGVKFRKTTVKNAAQVVMKINAFIDLINKEI